MVVLLAAESCQPPGIQLGRSANDLLLHDGGLQLAVALLVGGKREHFAQQFLSAERHHGLLHIAQSGGGIDTQQRGHCALDGALGHLLTIAALDEVILSDEAGEFTDHREVALGLRHALGSLQRGQEAGEVRSVDRFQDRVFLHVRHVLPAGLDSGGDLVDLREDGLEAVGVLLGKRDALHDHDFALDGRRLADEHGGRLALFGSLQLDEVTGVDGAAAESELGRAVINAVRLFGRHGDTSKRVNT